MKGHVMSSVDRKIIFLKVKKHVDLQELYFCKNKINLNNNVLDSTVIY